MDFLSVIESETRKDREAVERLARRYPGWEFVETKAFQGNVVPFAQRTKQQRNSAEALVIKALETNVSNEWTSRALFTYIRENGDGLPTNDDAAMNAINGALAELVEDKTVLRVYEGRGRDPHRYVLNDFSQQTRTADQ